MEITTCLKIFAAVSVIAPLVIEGVKKLLKNKEYDVDVLSATMAGVSALAICVVYMVVKGTYPTPTNVTYVICTVFCGIIGALCGYDKVYKIIFELFKNMFEKKGE